MGMSRPEPILATWKVSEVLRRYPQLLEVLIDLSPAFGRLRNPILRRVQTRLVTVAQAARVAGMEPSALVASLNTAIGAVSPPAPAAPPEDAAASAEDDSAFIAAPVAADLDARPFHARGEEPFSAIMAAAPKVPEGAILLLRNSFEPVPLYAVLARQGFTRQTRQLAPEEWEVRFLRSGRRGRELELKPGGSERLDATTGPAPEDAWGRPTATLTIDVSDLVPPEPMVRILETLEQLPPGASLLVHHVRRPVYLYPRLEDLGCTHETRELASGQVEILIQKPLASQTAPACGETSE
ncbi:MAG: DUF2249 domain-containing protein [Chloroflexi bacterium]|nr:DUF2249 domain-containing protein [Chloroflexota bacterium]